MGRYHAPGLYREDVSKVAATPLATGVPVFLGYGELVGETSLAKWAEFAKVGKPDPYLTGAVKGFFDCGGQQCSIVTLGPWTGQPVGIYPWQRAVLSLQDLDAVDLICAPSLMLEDTGVQAEVQTRILDLCRERRDCFAILDDNEDLLTKVSDEDRLRNGAFYAPWISLDGETYLPPCGHVAGVYARSDRKAGPHRTPANEVLAGVVKLKPDGGASPGANLLRAVPGRGIRVMGARTLVQEAASPWAFIGVRRLFTSVARHLLGATQWAAFEPNDLKLWIRLTRQLQSFCLDLYHRGALKGASAVEAFFVKCDEETNPRESREQGRVVVELGLAPTSPAEFIVVRLTQAATGSAISVSS